MIIDHLAIAVRSIDHTAQRLHDLFGYARHTGTVANTRQDVNVVFLRKEGSLMLKLIEPASPSSPLWDFVRKGGGLHHICFRVPDVEDACDDLMRKGARLLAPPQPGEAFDDHLIAFLYAGSGLNFEIIDTEQRRALVAPPNL